MQWGRSECRKTRQRRCDPGRVYDAVEPLSSTSAEESKETRKAPAHSGRRSTRKSPEVRYHQLMLLTSRPSHLIMSRVKCVAKPSVRPLGFVLLVVFEFPVSSENSHAKMQMRKAVLQHFNWNLPLLISKDVDQLFPVYQIYVYFSNKSSKSWDPPSALACLNPVWILSRTE